MDKKNLKKKELCNKPIFHFELVDADPELVNAIVYKYQNDPEAIKFKNDKIKEFSQLT